MNEHSHWKQGLSLGTKNRQAYIVCTHTQVRQFVSDFYRHIWNSYKNAFDKTVHPYTTRNERWIERNGLMSVSLYIGGG